MRLATNGILVNELGQVLLIQRNDTRTFAPPGGGVEFGELPTDNIAREVREETGIIALPIRLVSLTYWPMKPSGMLTFTFRCIQRGGDLQTSPESPRVGFYAANDLPSPMLELSRKRIEQGVRHAGGPVGWWIIEDTAVMRVGRFFLFHVIHRWLDIKRKMRQAPPFVPPPNWRVAVQTAVQQDNGDMLFLENAKGWQLPGGLVPDLTAPWETAVHSSKVQTGLDITLTNIKGIYVKEGSSQLNLLFTATVDNHSQPAQTGQWLPDFPAEMKQRHHLKNDASASNPEPAFRMLKRATAER